MRAFFARLLRACVLLRPTSSVRIVPGSDGSLPLRNSYDYIVVGAGIGGIVVANRLSEDVSVSVPLVEAGELDDRAEDITVPGNIGQENPSRYEWTMTTTPQGYLDNRTRSFPQGRVVGGSSILNGMCWTRGSAADYDAWKNLGNPGWGWTDLLPYFLKSENYTAHSNISLQSPLYTRHVQDEHGRQGPVQVGFPRYIYNQTRNFLDGVQELGIPLNEDLNSGDATAYLDPVLQRSNLELLTGFTVTRILSRATGNRTFQNLSQGLGGIPERVTIVGIELAKHMLARRYNVTCDRETILAAGAILSPVLLQISGFGPAQHLRSLNVNTLVHLPGVGSNLQDHPMIQPVYKYTAPEAFSALDIVGETKEAVRAEYMANRTGPWTATMVNAVAFPGLSQIRSQLPHLITNETTQHLPPTYDATLRAGYAAQQIQIQALLSRRDIPTYEVMATSWGQVAVGVMHSLSRGTVRAHSSSIFDNEPPILDPRWCSHAFDCEILRLGLELNDRLIATNSMTTLLPVRPAGLGTEDLKNRTALMETVRSIVRTGFHPSGTAAMMPRSAGGVVGTDLRVYGAKNLRVVDASIMPLIPGGHIQSAIYAIAEKAADIIKLRNWVGNQRGHL